jgi:hypothetical protein
MEVGFIAQLEEKDKIILDNQKEFDDFKKTVKEKEGKENESAVVVETGDGEKMKSELKVVSDAYEDLLKKYNDVMKSSGSLSSGDINCMLEYFNIVGVSTVDEFREVLTKFQKYRNSQKVEVRLHEESISARRIIEEVDRKCMEAKRNTEITRQDIEDPSYKDMVSKSGGFKSATAYRNAKARLRSLQRNVVSYSAQSAPVQKLCFDNSNVE